MREFLLRNVARVFGASFIPGAINTGTEPPEWVMKAIGWQPGNAPYVTERLALTLPVVWRCVDLLAGMISSCPPALYRQTGQNTYKREIDHPIADLLLEPNTAAGIGMPKLIGTVQTNYGLNGNGYIQIERDADGLPLKLWSLVSQETDPLVYDTTDPQRRRGLAGYRTSINGESVDLPVSDVVHIRGVTLDGWVGMSPIRTARLAVASGLTMEKYGLDFFLNESKSGGFIMHPGKLSEAAKDRVVTSIQRQGKRDGGNPNVIDDTKTGHKLKVLEEGMKYVATTIGPEEAQFLGSREFNISEIARMYGVPLVLLQSINGSTVWGTGIESLMIGFVTQTIMPIVLQWEDELTRKLLTVEERKEGLYIKIDTGGLTRGTALERAQVAQIYINAQALTPNEARADDGRNPLPGGDEVVKPPAPAATPPKEEPK